MAYGGEPTMIHSVRLPVKLFQEIKQEAEASDRTFNLMVVRMLQEQLKQRKGVVADTQEREKNV